MNQIVTDSNDFKVVTFKNIASFEFTPALGAMFNSRPIFGKAGKQSIAIGEELLMPYHVGRRLAINLAKAMIVKEAPAPQYEKESDKTGTVLYSQDQVTDLVKKILIGEYEDEKPAAESQTDILLRKYEELNALVNKLQGNKVASTGYKDKSEVIAELNRREIKFDARKSKAELEKLLSSPETPKVA